MAAPFKPKVIDVERISLAAQTGWTAPSTAWNVGEVREVALDQLNPNPDNARVWYSAEPLRQLSESLRTTGQLSPVLAFMNPQEQLTLIDGHRRWKAAELAGLPTVRVELKEAPPNRQALYLRSREANQLHSAQTVLDDAAAWRRLLDDAVFKNQRELAIFLGVSDSEISRIIALTRIPEGILNMLAAHEHLCQLKLLNAVREFHEAADEARTLALVEEIIANGLGYREVDARRLRLNTERPPRQQSWTIPITLPGAKGSIRLAQGGQKLQLNLEGLSPQESQSLADELKDWLAAR